MRKYQFQKKILLRSIFMMLGVFIIVTVVFAGYFIKTRTTEFEEQVDKQPEPYYTEHKFRRDAPVKALSHYFTSASAAGS